MKKLNQVFLLFSLILSVFFSQVHSTYGNDTVDLKVLSSVTAIGGQTTVMLGLEFSLPNHWKLYTPQSDEKSPVKRHPQLEIKHSDNLKSIKILWPQSQTITEDGETISVYKDRVILPVVVEIDNPNLPMGFNGTVSFIACHRQCVPYDLPIDFTLPSGEATTTLDANNIKAFQLGMGDHGLIEIEESPFIYMILIAFLGGVILNFMPCVLPVLSLKLRTLVKQSHVKAGLSYKAHFIATILGILVSFMAYGMIAVVLQTSGQSLGWGMHFQEPLFLVGMALLMVLFTANLWGAFDIHFSATLQTKMHTMINHQRAKVRLYAEGFLSGVFATLLATPCTAPFLGTTLGYALSHGPLEIMILFMTLGVGFAMPYWIALILPPRLMPVPKPGRWLDWVSRTLGLGLLLTTLWLLWLFYQMNGPLMMVLVGSLLTILFGALFFRDRYGFLRKLIIPLCIMTLAVPMVLEEEKSQIQEHSDALWHPFEPDKIPGLIQQGKIVVVDITASWCVTCQINKAGVLKDRAILKMLESPQVYCMQADWTVRSPFIRSYLARHQRYGIPFNQIFGPQSLTGTLLPELLTVQAVMNTLRAAGYEDLITDG